MPHRQVLHALRAHAAEAIAWRGSRAGVLVGAAVLHRKLMATVLRVWHVYARTGSAEREKSVAISAVLTERLAAAEVHFAAILQRQAHVSTTLKVRRMHAPMHARMALPR